MTLLLCRMLAEIKITMKITFVLLVSMFLTSNLNAQDSLLMGKWQLLEMKRESVLVFDRNDIDVSVKARFQNALKTEDSLNHSDSLVIMEYVASIHPKMQQIYYEFFENGALKAGLLDLKEGDYFFTEKDGLYIVDIEKIRIRVKGGIDSNI